MRRVVPIILMVGCTVLLFLILHSVQAQGPPGDPGPYTPDYVTITTTNPSTGSELVTDIYYPASGGVVSPTGAPHPTLVFAHGYMAPREGYTGYGEHLGSWGYIIAIPSFPDDDVEVRASDVQHLLSYLESENANEDSLFYQMIDTDRFGMSGHSLGGMGTLMVTAREDRVNMAGVPLDPAGSELGDWDYETEAPSITIPIAVIGAPSQTCNSNAEYENWYLSIGATHKAKFVIADGSHCDFMNTDDEFLTTACGLFCGEEYSAERSAIAMRYATAWFNYYILLETDYYTYLYGDEADSDIQAGLITRTVNTAPRDVAATGQFGAVKLSWTLYDHPIIAGYNVYRSLQSGDYLTTPYALVGRESSYVDTDVVAGQEYFYVLRSRDSAGNEHQISDEVSATPKSAPVLLSPPNGTMTTTQAITFAWQAGAGSSPEGYNLKLDGDVVTTTGTTSATILSVGVHTWTVRAYDTVSYSNWVSPAWTVEVITSPATPVLLSPPNGTVTTARAITFTWQAGAGSSPAGYNFKLDGAVVTTTGATSATILSMGTHTWTVRAYNAVGYSDWVTPAWTVKVIAPPAAPVLLRPSNGIVTATQAITFAWQAGTGPSPEGYNLKLDGVVITTTDTTSSTILSMGVHTWTVRAYNADGYSEWVMPVWTVEVITSPVAPILLFPFNGTVTTTQAITFAWQAGMGATPTGYDFQLDGSVVTTTDTASATILSVGVHTWTVRAYNLAGFSEWVTPTWTVEVIAPPVTPVLLFPPDGVVTTTQDITFAWQAGIGPSPEGYNFRLDGVVITTTETTSSTVLSMGVHTWTVRAYNADGYSEWVTPAWTVEITETLPPPSTPTLLAPPDGTITTTQAVTFAWQASAGAAPAGYNLQVNGNVITTTATVSPTVLPFGVYVWTVRAYNASGASEWAAPWMLEVRHYHVYLPLVQRDLPITDSQ